MANWRDIILNEFVPGVSKLTIVADPDNLLTEEKVVLELRERGFDLIEFADPIEFRFVYESGYRTLWDKQENSDLVVILHRPDSLLESLPYDLLKAGRYLSFNLGNIFPNLSYPVIDQLDLSQLDLVFEAYTKVSLDRLSDNQTKDFILKHVYRLVPDTITSDADIFQSLLRLHFNNISLPKIFADRFIQKISGNTLLSVWPLIEILRDSHAFFTFLQERWPIFLENPESADQLMESSETYELNYAGPSVLPFGHQDIRIYIDDLFAEGKLHPVDGTHYITPEKAWYLCGISHSNQTDKESRIDRLLSLVEKDSPDQLDNYSGWITFAMRWAELGALIHSGSESQVKQKYVQIANVINKSFAFWLADHFSGLITLPPVNPVMVHQIPHRMARDFSDNKNTKVALLVLDGLSLDQWVAIRQILQEQVTDLLFNETAVFAWLPTLTCISRQAIFSGKQPRLFPKTINRTDKDSDHWKVFWENEGLKGHEIVYLITKGDGDVNQIMEDAIHPDQTKVIGLVIDKADKIVHGMQLGMAGMHNQVRQWCTEGFLANLIGYLLLHNFQIWLTSDHGNIECEGIGRLSEGSVADTRGEKVRICPTKELRAQVNQAVPEAICWEPIGLPERYYPLMLEGSKAFQQVGSTIVTHGGISVEEVIVPFVKIERKNHGR